MSIAGNIAKSSTDLLFSSIKTNYDSLGKIIDKVQRDSKKIKKDTAKEDITKLIREYNEEARTSYRKFVKDMNSVDSRQDKSYSENSNPFKLNDDEMRKYFHKTKKDLDTSKDFEFNNTFSDRPITDMELDKEGNEVLKELKKISNNHIKNIKDSGLLGLLAVTLNKSTTNVVETINQSFEKVNEVSATKADDSKTFYTDVIDRLNLINKSISIVESNTENDNGPSISDPNLYKMFGEGKSLGGIFGAIQNELGRQQKYSGKRVGVSNGLAADLLGGNKLIQKLAGFDIKVGQVVPRILASSLGGDALDDVLGGLRNLTNKGKNSKFDKGTRTGRLLSKITTFGSRYIDQLDPSKGADINMTEASHADPSTPVPFDAETHTSINKVIPGYFAKIIAAMSGDEEIYHDYRTGKWITKGEMKEKFEKERMNNAINSLNGSGLGSDLKKILGNEKESAKKLLEVFYKGERGKITDVDEKDSYDSIMDKANSSKLNKNTIETIRDLFRNSDVSYNSGKTSHSLIHGITQSMKNALTEDDEDKPKTTKATPSNVNDMSDVIAYLADKLDENQPNFLGFMKDILGSVRDILGATLKPSSIKTTRPEYEVTVVKNKKLTPVKTTSEDENPLPPKTIDNSGTLIDKLLKATGIGEFISKTKLGSAFKSISSSVGGLGGIVKRGLGSNMGRLASSMLKSGLIAGGTVGLANAVSSNINGDKIYADSLPTNDNLTSPVTNLSSESEGYNLSKILGGNKKATLSNPRGDNKNQEDIEAGKLGDSEKKKLSAMGVSNEDMNDPDKLARLGMSMSPLANIQMMSGSRGNKMKKDMEKMERAIDDSGLAGGKDVFASSDGNTATVSEPGTTDNSDRDKVFAKLTSSGLSTSGAIATMSAIQSSGTSWGDASKDVESTIDKLKKSSLDKSLSKDGDADKMTSSNYNAIKKALGLDKGSKSGAKEDATELIDKYGAVGSGGQGSSDDSDKKNSNDSQDTSSDTKIEKMIRYAKSKIGSGYSMAVRTGPQYDCSGLVYMAMKEAGFKVPESAWATPAMYLDATGPHQYLKTIDAKDAKRGDIIVWGGAGGFNGNGHTAILLEAYKSDKSEKLIQATGGVGVTDQYSEADIRLVSQENKIYARIVGSKGSDVKEDGSATSSDEGSKESEDPFKDMWLNESDDDKKKDIERIKSRYDKRYDKARKELEDKLKTQAKEAEEYAKKHGNSRDLYTDGNGDAWYYDADGKAHKAINPDGSTYNPLDPDNSGNFDSNGSSNKSQNIIDIIAGNNRDKLDPDRATAVQVQEYISNISGLDSDTEKISDLLKKIKIRISQLNAKGDDSRLSMYRSMLDTIKKGISLDSNEETLFEQIENNMPTRL